MIQLQISPEVEQQVVLAARARGLEPDAFVSQLVTDAVANYHTTKRRLTPDEFRASLDRLAELGKGIPALPDYAFTRESFYEDHD